MEQQIKKYGSALVDAVAKYREEFALILSVQAREQVDAAPPGVYVVKDEKPVTPEAIQRDNDARNKALGAIDKAYSAVSDSIGADIAKPPSEEQTRVLQVLSLRDPRSVTQFEIDTIAQKVRGNHQASSALADIAVRFKLDPPEPPRSLILQGLANDAREIAVSAVEVHGSRVNSDVSVVADAIEKRLNGKNQFGGKLGITYR